MEAIKQIVRIPKDHEMRIKIPDHVPDPVEIIMFFRKKPGDYDNKINELKSAMKDEALLNRFKRSL
ncbi:hypothetical protein GWO43_15840 [candidate division KSB1 bacterium]|nr:hypothetical protein [candidate division KSB1 bacterium]NIR68586.1 hypothetical protein [candidate division KSB1 bacterium]NIS25423.1 hypothetical protein [candidate division KSB1 bacterium]NIT72315.1 hypothetical protein [candidate division KSB1 bacterium]NIU26099.1 hypothetical protein [candidate division KSB1 bacterium]